ncbi:hypothetical protein SDC9_133073 [bioreactor metagenome]|uniref:Uncharacterized protein n=1 Tax=bioreactor metagenome TaxID=1076179 RepID=A0A645D8X0_9ZZZZ
METFIKVLHNVCPLLFSFCHFVEFFFDSSGKVEVHDFREELCKEVVNHHAYIGGE